MTVVQGTKTRFSLIAVLLAFAVSYTPGAQSTEHSQARLAQLVEANIIAVHAFQVLLKGRDRCVVT